MSTLTVHIQPYLSLITQYTSVVVRANLIARLIMFWMISLFSKWLCLVYLVQRRFQNSVNYLILGILQKQLMVFCKMLLLRSLSRFWIRHWSQSFSLFNKRKFFSLLSHRNFYFYCNNYFHIFKVLLSQHNSRNNKIFRLRVFP